MKFIFFAVTEYPGVKGSLLEEELRKCGAEVYIAGKGVDLVIVKIKDERQADCVEKVLDIADMWYFEMIGAPKVLRVRSPKGVTKAEVEFS